MIKNVLAFILLFLTVFDLKIIGSIGSANITSIICILIILISPRPNIYANFLSLIGCFKYFLSFYLFILSYILFRTISSGAEEIAYLLTTLKSTSGLISIFLYLIVFFDNRILERMFNVFVLNAIFCLFFGTFPEFKFLIRFFQYGIENNLLIGSNEYRNAFLAGSGYFGISSLYSLFFVILVYFLFKEKTILNYIKAILFMFAGIMAGRIALISFFITGIFYFIFKRNFNVLFLFLFFIGFGWFILNNFQVFEQANLWVSDLFLRDDVTENNSVNHYITTMLFLPEGFTLYWGDGKYDNYYGGSDIGYVRNILFGGLFYLLLIIVALFLSICKVKYRLVLLIMIFISLFLHMKGVFIFNNPGFFPVFISCVFYFYRFPEMNR